MYINIRKNELQRVTNRCANEKRASLPNNFALTESNCGRH